MKLFVVGERSSNPDDWIVDAWRAFVLADTPERAIEMVGDLPIPKIATEISHDSEAVLTIVEAGLRE